MRCLSGIWLCVPGLCAGEALADPNRTTALASYDWGVVYTAEVWRNASGGRRVGYRYLDNLDLTFDWDLQSAFGWRGASLFAYALYNNAASLSEDLVGDAQTVSNIDAPEALRLYEFWYQQSLGDALDLRLGLYDLNSEFDVINASRLFINSSHGIGAEFSQTGANGPSIFPVTSLGLRMSWALAERWTLRAALLDAVPGDPDDPSRTTIRLGDGALSVVELEAEPSDALRFAAGYWRYSDRVAPVAPTSGARGVINEGAYVLGEATLWREADREQGLSVFLRIGFADEDANPFDRYAGAGLHYVGLLPGRPQDSIGLAWARAENGTPFLDAQRAAGAPLDRHETAWELSYRFEVIRGLTLQPDIQYIVNPGTDPALDDALVLGLRIELAIGG